MNTFSKDRRAALISDADEKSSLRKGDVCSGVAIACLAVTNALDEHTVAMEDPPEDASVLPSLDQALSFSRLHLNSAIEQLLDLEPLRIADTFAKLRAFREVRDALGDEDAYVTKMALHLLYELEMYTR